MKKFTSLNISIKKIGILFCRYFTFVGCIFPSTVKALENDGTYVSERSLIQEEMIDIFSQGYIKIIAYDNDSSTSRLARSGTHSVTTCTQMKKKSHGWSVGIGGVSISFPVGNHVKGTGGISLSNSEIELLSKGYYLCIRFKVAATWAKYTSRIYDNTSGQLLGTTTYNHTYTFKANGSNGLDYYHEVRTPAQLNEIRNSGYVGTSAERSAMPAWRTISNPNSVSILP